MTWTCDHCDAPVSLTSDPEAFVDHPVSGYLEIICERCREKLWDRQQERAMEEAP